MREIQTVSIPPGGCVLVFAETKTQPTLSERQQLALSELGEYFQSHVDELRTVIFGHQAGSCEEPFLDPDLLRIVQKLDSLEIPDESRRKKLISCLAPSNADRRIKRAMVDGMMRYLETEVREAIQNLPTSTK